MLPNDEHQPDTLLTASEVASLLGKPVRHTRHLMKVGAIPAWTEGRRSVTVRRHVQEYLARTRHLPSLIQPAPPQRRRRDDHPREDHWRTHAERFAEVQRRYHAWFDLGPSEAWPPLSPMPHDDARHRDVSLVYLARALADIKAAPWYGIVHAMDRLDPHRLLREMHDHYFRRGGHWPDAPGEGGRRGDKVPKAWRNGKGWLADLFVSLREPSQVTIDLEAIGNHLGMDFSSLDCFANPQVVGAAFQWLTTTVSGRFWASLEVSDVGKVHFHLLADPQPTALGFRNTTIENALAFQAKAKYLYKRPLPIPGSRRNSLPPMTVNEVHLAMQVTGRLTELERQRKAKGERHIKRRRRGTGRGLIQ